jgi:RNA polymerase sigma factor (sigma-70 family)
MPTAQTSSAGNDLQTLVSAARSGDNLAWTQLVDRFERMLRSVARSYRLSPHDVDDAVQATWIKLYEHIDQIRDHNAIAGWLATTVRRESLRLLQTHVRENLTEDLELTSTDQHDTPEHVLLTAERQDVLQRALATLPDRQRRLMTLIATDAASDYRQISSALDMPIGSIGPIRARSLARLGRHTELREFATAS